MSSRSIARFAAVALAGVSLAACSSEIDNKPAAQVTDAPTTASAPAAADRQASTAEAAAQALALDPAQSSFEFVGAKVTGDHRGTFKLYGGNLKLAADGTPSALEVEVDLASLQIEPDRLLNHLKSPDFFDVEKFPKARFSLEQIAAQPSAEASHRVSGVLELHGVTKQIEFPAKLEISDRGATGSALFTINRQDFGIVYPGKPDDLIKDEVLLDLKLVFTRT
jgi:polyisoprenoid-binding protein YceI